MAVPDFQRFLRRVLGQYADDAEWRARDLGKVVGSILAVSQSDSASAERLIFGVNYLRGFQFARADAGTGEPRRFRRAGCTVLGRGQGRSPTTGQDIGAGVKTR